ncbi:MAG: nuclear transport factor 2 family protein, partial [Alphaproteobacteria bacterium]|nr:nuclear transport factor 2 family protein [Alphaproteobacteria bacterium]
MSKWARGDIDGVLGCVADDVTYELNLDDKVVKAGGLVRGRQAVRANLQFLLDTFEFGALVTDHLTVEGATVRARMKIVYIHIATGERLKTSYRLVMENRDGLVAHMKEYHDAPYVEA